MRVLVSPQAQSLSYGVVTALCRSLVDEAEEVAPTPTVAPLLPPRQLTAAEVQAVRQALLGDSISHHSGQSSSPRTGVVGYICVGREVGPGCAQEVVVVEDHVGLAWDSPLRGPNDDRLGPRFPRTDEVYAPEVARDRFSTGLGATISVATVAGVRFHARLTEWESQMVAVLGIQVVSAQLVPFAVIAAHLGLRVAAAVVLQD